MTFEFVDNAGNTGSKVAKVVSFNQIVDLDFNNAYFNNGLYKTTVVKKGILYTKLQFMLNKDSTKLEVMFNLQNANASTASDLSKLSRFNNSTITLKGESNNVIGTYNASLTLLPESNDKIGIVFNYNNTSKPLPAGNYELVFMILDGGGLKEKSQMIMNIESINQLKYKPSNSYSGTLYIEVVASPNIL
jgi:hypothetical protein